MESLKTYIKRDELLHAYGLEGDCDVCEKELLAFFEDTLSVSIRGNADFRHFSYDVFGIGEARTLKSAALVRAFQDQGKFFLIRFNGITREAQNALLKLFEEPTPQTHFFLVFPSAELLLPTLRSRLFLISGGASAQGNIANAKKFVNSSPPERLNVLKEIIENKDKTAALTFLNELEMHLHGEVLKNKGAAFVQALYDVEQARSYLNDRAPSVKMLLEQVALSIPAGS